SGIGFAVVKALAQAGAKVVLSDVREEAGRESAAALQNCGLDVRPFTADASREDDIAQLLQFAIQDVGALDIVVNNAGIQHVAAIEDFPTDKFRQIV
ncbi:MAG: SDR family NAD(P)-dependent oxidoreductase, partial [Firmicutes bacterium]|nr:SDR family NAD(P)-dependent oxidoreductase [Bacillota bacterium]